MRGGMDFARIFRLLGAGLLVLVLASCAAGVALVGPRPFAHETSDLPVNPEILWGRLDNGVRYAVWPLPKRDKVSLRLLVEAGSINETDQERGLAHFLEHMAFNGSEHLPPGTMVAELQKLGVGSTHNNADTGFERTLYKLDLPGASEALMEKGLFILRETAGGLTFPARQIEQERRAVLAEMRGRGSPGSRVFEASLGMVFGDWLATRWPIGSREVIERVQRDDFVRFYRRWYRPQRLVVIAVGPVDGKAVERLIRTRFGDLHAPDRAIAPDPAFPPLMPRGTAIRLVPEQADNLTIVLLAAEPLDRYRDDFAEREKATMLELAFRILNRRLNDRSLAAGAMFSVTRVGTWVQFSRARIGAIELATTRAHWREAVAAAEQELRRALSYGFTEPEVAAAKAEVRKNWQQQLLASEAGMNSTDAVESLVRSIPSDLVVASLKPVIERLDKAIEPVGGAALQAALHALWMDGDRRRLLSGPVGGDISEAAVAAAVRASEAVALKPPEAKKDTPFAYKSFGAPGAVVYRDKPRPDLTVAAFANGSRAVVLSAQGPYTHIHVAVDVMGGGRMAQPDGRDGLAYLANRYFLAGGLGAHSFSELDRLLKSRNVDLGFAVADSQFQFTVSAPAEELPFVLRVVTAYLAAPGFREEGFALARGSLDRLVAEIGAAPKSVIEHYLPRRRCAGDPRCGLPDLGTLKARRWDELKAWLAPALREAPLIVTVVGQTEAEAALKELAATIGALPIRRAVPRERAPEKELPTLPPGAVETLTYTGRDNGAFAVVEFPVPSMRDYPHWIREGLVARLLAQRVRDSLRVAAGESFGPAVMQLPGWLRVQVDAGSDRVREAALRVMTVVREIETRPFTEEEMSRVVPVALRVEDESRGQARTWLQALRGQPEPTAAFDRLNQTRGIIASTTLEEINALARELLKPETARTYLVVPAATSR